MKFCNILLICIAYVVNIHTAAADELFLNEVTKLKDTIAVSNERNKQDYVALVKGAFEGNEESIRWLILLTKFGGYDAASMTGHAYVLNKLLEARPVEFQKAYGDLSLDVKKAVIDCLRPEIGAKYAKEDFTDQDLFIKLPWLEAKETTPRANQ